MSNTQRTHITQKFSIGTRNDIMKLIWENDVYVLDAAGHPNNGKVNPIVLIPSTEKHKEIVSYICRVVNAHEELIEVLKYCKLILDEVATQNCWKGEKHNLVNKAIAKADKAIQQAENEQ